MSFLKKDKQQIRYPSGLIEFGEYKPRNPEEDEAKLEAMLTEIWGGKASDEDKIALQDFINKCGISGEALNQLEKAVKGALKIPESKEEKPVLLRFDFNQTPMPESATATFRVQVTNLHDKRFLQSIVSFHSPSLSFTPEQVNEGPLDIARVNTFTAQYTVPKPLGTMIDIHLELQDHKNVWRVYRLDESIIVQFAPSQNQPGETQINIGKTARVAIHNAPRKANINIDEGAQVDMEYASGENNAQGNKNIFVGVGADYRALRYKLDWELSHRLNQNTAQNAPTSANIVKVKAQSAILTRLSPSNNIPKTIYLHSQPLIILGRKGCPIADWGLDLPQTAEKKAYDHASRIQGALWLNPQGELSYLGSGAHADHRNGNAIPNGIWRKIANGDRFNLAQGMYSYKVSIEQADLETQSPPPSKAQQALIEAYEVFLSCYDAYREAENADEQQKLITQLKEKYQQFIQLRQSTTFETPVRYARLFYNLDTCSKSSHLRDEFSHIILPDTLPIGRAEDAGLRPDDDNIRPLHAELSYKDSAYWLRSTADDDIVWVNDNSLKYNDVVPLGDKDHFYLGKDKKSALHFQISLNALK